MAHEVRGDELFVAHREDTGERPGPGDEYVVYVVKFATVGEYIEHLPSFEKEALFPVPIEDSEALVNTPCLLPMDSFSAHRAIAPMRAGRGHAGQTVSLDEEA